MSKDGHIGQASLDPDFLQGTIWACGASQLDFGNLLLVLLSLVTSLRSHVVLDLSEHIISSDQALFYSSRDKRSVIKIAREFLHWGNNFDLLKMRKNLKLIFGS